jgi:hypothetical protein
LAPFLKWFPLIDTGVPLYFSENIVFWWTTPVRGKWKTREQRGKTTDTTRCFTQVPGSSPATRAWCPPACSPPGCTPRPWTEATRPFTICGYLLRKRERKNH